MRYKVINDTVTSDRLHSRDVFGKEKALAKGFVGANKKSLSDHILPCPVSGKPREGILFEKWGVAYSLCPETYTLSLSYGLDSFTLKEYQDNSALSLYRGEDAYQEMIGQTRQELFRELLEWVEIRLIRYKFSPENHVIDYRTKHRSWMDRLVGSEFVKNLELKDPYPFIGKSNSTAEADVVLAIDSLQGCLDVGSLFNDFYQAMRPGGLLFIGTRNGAGMDVLALKGDNDTIYPYEHVTLLSLEGLEVLARESGFEVLETSTPGLLDCEFVNDHIKQNHSTDLFFDYLFTHRGIHTRQSFQSFLQTNNLSSYLRAVLRKK